MEELVAWILECYLDIKFWFKKKKRRKFEKENNLPKKTMIYPSDKIAIVSMVIGVVLIILYMFFIQPMVIENRTKTKLNDIVTLLESEKRVTGFYPEALNSIIRNNPLRKNITRDALDYEIQYKLSSDQKSYVLFSVGKDGQPNTNDDIILTD
jgi:amino acid transporter